jgi:hypothetical protein
MPAMQTLDPNKQLVLYYSLIQVLVFGGTDKIPSINMQLRAHFCRFGNRKFHTVGSGSTMITRSTMIFIIATASSKLLSLSHRCGIVMSQKALTGLKGSSVCLSIFKGLIKRGWSHLHAVMSAIVVDMVYKMTKHIVAHTLKWRILCTVGDEIRL